MDDDFARRTRELLLGTPEKSDLALSVIVIDCSTSMRRFGDAPRSALQEHVDELREDRDAARLATAIVGFHRGTQVIVPPTPVGAIAALPSWALAGGTRLYASVDDALRVSAATVRDIEASGRGCRVVFAVLTDGEDNASPSTALASVRGRAAVARAKGWTLLTFGYGVMADRIAETMGFPSTEGSATSAAPDAASLRRTMSRVTHVTLESIRPPRS
jgi:uncharacterized protein YegL